MELTYIYTYDIIKILKEVLNMIIELEKKLQLTAKERKILKDCEFLLIEIAMRLMNSVENLLILMIQI